ncbi:MAG: YihY/virulence factor BrkB family protein [Blautia sp.]|nr:YihY/virulence factor BrkB family protein [Blautia sp.]
MPETPAESSQKQKEDKNLPEPAKEKKKTKKEITLGFVHRSVEDHIGAYAAQAAYFLFLSFIPFILFMTTLIRYTDLSYNMLSSMIRGVVPRNLQSFVMELVSEVYNRNTAIMPITALLALWSAGKAIQSLINGLNTIYHVKETRNWLINRIYAVFYTFLFGMAIAGSLVFLVLGGRLEKMLQAHLPRFMVISISIFGFKTMVMCVAIFLIFVFLYRVLPNRKATFKSQAPGAAIIAVAWTIFSNLFSLYFELFPGFNNMYGSLTALIILMFWLYWIMLFVLYGAEINAYFEKQFRMARDSMIDMINEAKSEMILDDIVLVRPVDSIPKTDAEMALKETEE